MDIRDEKQVYSGVQKIISQYGKLTHLCNNAGGQFLSSAAQISPRGWRSVIDLNLNGTWNVTRAVYDLWMGNHGGSIVNVILDHRNGFVL